MRPSPLDSIGSRPREHDSHSMAQQDSVLAASARRRTRAEESWIEISSQPSSSSINSMTANTFSRLPEERIPRPLIPARSVTEPPRSASATGSSQDEYEESSSESDRVLSSSNEDLVRDDEDDEDDNRTALAPRTIEVFTPQPNAFSHPPTSQQAPDSYFPRVASAPNSHIRSRPHLQRARERAMTSSHQPDHDAALRASLTTLLSCAAAVRPKPAGTSTSPVNTDKSHDGQIQRANLTRPSTQPTTLRLIPESALPSQPRPPTTNPTIHNTANISSTTPKRRSRSTSKDRYAKKARSQPISCPSSYDDYFISPTVASWVISAGMVLVLSAISFSAGFVWGREVGRVEGELGLVGAGGMRAGDVGGSCARDALRGSNVSSGVGSGLGRLHWGAGSAVRA